MKQRHSFVGFVPLIERREGKVRIRQQWLPLFSQPDKRKKWVREQGT